MDRRGPVHVYLRDDAAALGAIQALLSRTGRSVIPLHADSVRSALPEIELLFAGEPPSVDWAAATRLRFIQFMGSGTEGIWSATGLRRDVLLANARGIHLPEMRDHALALMLGIERGLPRFVRQQEAHAWRPVALSTVAGKTVALLGLGEVGRSLVGPCKALGMRVVGARATRAPVPSVDTVFGPEEIADMLAIADYLVVTVPLTQRTRGLLDARGLERLPRHAVVIQLSRGAVLDAAALEAALRSGRLRAAAMDVFDDEPLPPTSSLWSTPNLVITPHVGGRVPDYLERVIRLFEENLDRVDRGERPRTEISWEREY